MNLNHSVELIFIKMLSVIKALREILKEYYEQISEVSKVLRCIFSSKDIFMKKLSTKKFEKGHYYHISKH